MSNPFINPAADSMLTDGQYANPYNDAPTVDAGKATFSDATGIIGPQSLPTKAPSKVGHKGEPSD